MYDASFLWTAALRRTSPLFEPPVCYWKSMDGDQMWSRAASEALLSMFNVSHAVFPLTLCVLSSPCRPTSECWTWTNTGPSSWSRCTRWDYSIEVKTTLIKREFRLIQVHYSQRDTSEHLSNSKISQSNDKRGVWWRTRRSNREIKLEMSCALGCI